MKRKSAKDALTEAMLPEDEVVLDYDPHDGPCCTVQTFLPDLNSPPHSSWNTSVIEVFVEHFMQLHPRAPQDRVEELFGGHLKYLCTRWQNTTMDPKKVKSRQKLLNRAERQRNVSPPLSCDEPRLLGRSSITAASRLPTPMLPFGVISPC